MAYTQKGAKFLCAQIDWLNDDIKAVLADAADYTVNLTTHEFLSNIPLIARTGVSDSLADKLRQMVGLVHQVLLFKIRLVMLAKLSLFSKILAMLQQVPLIAYIDSNVQNLPLFINGAKVTVLFDSGVLGIFRI